MSVDGYEPIIDEQTGEQTGWAFFTDDGVAAAADLTGEVVAIEGEDGEVYEVPEGEYHVVSDDFPALEAGDAGDEYEDPYPELTERLDQLEQAVSEPREVEYVEADDYDVDADLALQADYAEQALGRKFTMPERRRIHEEALADLIAGEKVDIGVIAERLEEMGEPLLDLDTGHRGQDHEARTQLMTQLAQDDERIADHHAGVDDVTYEQPPQSRESYDLDSREERHAYLADRLRDSGADPSDTYSSSDYEQED